MPVQAVCLMLPGHAKASFARFYWSVVCRLLGLRVRLIGAPPGTANGRRVVYVSNHSSWLDIPVLGGMIDACFVAKDEVGGWPFVGTIARLGPHGLHPPPTRGPAGSGTRCKRDSLPATTDLLPEGRSRTPTRAAFPQCLLRDR